MLIDEIIRAQALGRPRRRSVYGAVGFGLVVVTLAVYLVLPLSDRHLFSENPVLDFLGTVSLVLAPPFAVCLATRHWVLTGRVFISLITFSLGGLLTAMSVVAIILGYVS